MPIANILLPGMRGSNVATLQQWLRSSGQTIAPAEMRATVLGPSTANAVRALQNSFGMEPTGVADAAFLDRLRASIAGTLAGVQPGTSVVEGPVTDGDGNPISNAKVVLSAVTLAGARPLGQATTDAHGFYRITYAAPAAAAGHDAVIAEFPAAGPSAIQVVLLDANGQPRFTSAITYNPPPEATIPIHLGGPTRTQPAEHATLIKTIAQVSGGIDLTKLVENDKQQQLSFIAGAAAIAKPNVAFASIAARLAAKTQLAPELFYGLLRHGVPANGSTMALAAIDNATDLDLNAQRLLRSLYLASDATRAAAINAALGNNTLPASYQAKAQADLAQLSKLAAAFILTIPLGTGKAGIGDVLGAAGVPAEIQQSFAPRLATTKSRVRLWKTLAANKTYPPAQLATLRFATTIGTATRGHLPLVTALIAMRSSGKIKSARDLAKLTVADWKALLQQRQADGQPIGAPAGIVKQDPAHALDYYAGLLEASFSRSFPTTAFVSRLANDATSTLKQKAAIATFIDANPTFSLPRSNVDKYLSDNAVAIAELPIDVPAMRQDLLACQRMIKVAPTYALAKPLLDKGITSAQHVYRMGSDRFIQTFGADANIGVPAAKQMYAKARQTHARALALLSQVNADFNAYNPAAVAPAGQPAQNAAAVAGLPNLEMLFGSLDQCACRDCQSVLSAAAYLVDMLYFLSQRAANAPGKSAKDLLLARRADIAKIQLTCPNTNTELPYIDLVNEILEAAVAPGDPNADPKTWQTTLTTPELNAFPERINASAYATLAKPTSVFPWTLPFDLPLAEARAYLGQLSIDRARLMKLFTPQPDLKPTDISPLATEILGLSTAERDIIIAQAPGNQLFDYWGLQQGAQTVPDPSDPAVSYTEPSWTGILSHVRVLLARSGLTFDQLSQLLNTTYLNKDGKIVLTPNPADSCDLAKMVVTAPSPAAYSAFFGGLHRFVRLWRHLRWSIYELDGAMRMLQPAPPGGDALNALLLRQVAVVDWAAKRFSIPVSSAVALFAAPVGNPLTYQSALDVTDIPALPGEDAPHYSLYHNLFLNKTVLNPPDPAFALNNLPAADTLETHIPAFVAAFGTSDADMRSAIAQIPKDALTLPNIGLLDSYATLALANGTALKDLVRLISPSAQPPGRGLLEIEQTAAPGFAQLTPAAGSDASAALFDASNPERLVTFTELLDQINATSFSVAQLDYLLRHNFDESAAIAPDDLTIGTFYFNLRAGLIKLAQGFVPSPDPQGTQTARLLNQLLKAADAGTVMKILAGTSADPDAAQKANIANLLGPYMDPADAQAKLAGAGATLAKGEARYEYVLTNLLQYQARVASTALAIQQIGVEFKLPTSTAAMLANAWLPSRKEVGKHLIDDLLVLPTIKRTGDDTQPITADEASKDGFAPYAFFDSYVAMHKFASVINGFGLKADETAWLMKNGVNLGWLDPSKLPLAPSPVAGRFVAWRRLADAVSVKARLPSDGTVFTTVFDNATTMDKSHYFDALIARTQWSADVLQQVAGDKTDATKKGSLSLTYPDDFKSERALTKIIPCIIQLRRLGISADVSAWTGSTITPDQAHDIIQNVKSKYPIDQWPTVAKPLRDPLREKQRDALVAYLLTRPPAPKIRWYDADDVYSWYLIDVEMGACALTSRIVQANASIQQFVQRCFLNLEPGITIKTVETTPPSAPPADAAWLQWQWMYRYRLWQANREVFLWPENWIDPSLRKDKSPFYSDLETELRQSPVTTDSAEDAFRNYLDKLDAVARLDVVGLFHDTETRADGQVDIVHVVARGQGSPTKYYYRQWLDHSYWTAWTEIKLDITSDHVLPVIWNRRLYLFWATVALKPIEQQTLPTATELTSGTSASSAAMYLEIKLAWSEFKKGKWLATQTSAYAFVDEGAPNTYYVALKSHFDGSGNLIIDVFEESGEQFDLALVGRFVLGGVGNAVDVITFDGGWDPTRYASEARNDLQLPPPQTGLGFNLPMHSQGEGDWIIHNDAYTTEVTRGGGDRPRISPCFFSYLDTYNTLQSALVLSQADWYRLVVPHQDLFLDSQLPFFFQDSRRTYFVVPSLYTQAGYFTTTSTQQIYHQAVTTAFYTFYPFYHAFVPLFLHELNRGGVDRLFNPALQQTPMQLLETPAPAFDFKGYYQPADIITPPLPAEGVDFDSNAGYALYNWELFFHAPFEIAMGLSTNQRFDEAKHWYEYVFNPTSSDISQDAPGRFWVTKPFNALGTGDITKQQIAAQLALIHTSDPLADKQVAQWQKDPFDPHMIATFRPVAYMRAIVMKYLDNLIAWGDYLFKQDTLESVNEATQLYVLAAQLLGPRPEITPPREVPKPQTYDDLEAAGLDRFANAVVAAENAIEPVNESQPVDPNAPPLPLLPTMYFCIPPNDTLLKYWDTVGDRLFKIRHCMNIEGVTQQLALFAPPIDPGILVRAVAAGVDLGSILSDVSAPVPPYRFEVIVRHALEVCEQVRSFGSQLLSILEKDDAEQLGLLRSGADKQLQAAIVNLKQRAVDQAQQEIDVVDKTRAAIQKRSAFYEKRRTDLVNTLEAVALVLQGAGIVSDVLAVVFEATSGGAAVAPDAQVGAAGVGGSPTAVVDWGGSNISDAAAGFARAARVASAILHTSAAMAATLGGYQRRADEWNLQADIAASELDQNTSQRLAASIRRDLATLELQNQQAVAQTASDVDDFLHSKFTNQELYDWMIAQSGATYLQAYQLAYSIAKRAERCFQRELGLGSSNYIQFGYWDSLRKGLLAGDQLLVDLQTMLADHRMRNVRERELTTSFSLLANDPFALVELRAKGQCFVTIPKLWLDMENPGLYMRRIKAVSVTVPSVVGPYANVSLTVTLLDNDTTMDTKGTVLHDTGGQDAIITSSGQADSGLFELRFGDERYLPFEGSGLENSSWQLKLNQVYPQFDYSTISDVVLQIRYTARDGGEVFASANADKVRAGISKVFSDADAGKGPALFRYVSVRHEYPSAWAAFLSPGAGKDQVLNLDVGPERFPFFTSGADIKVNGMDAIAKLSDPGPYHLLVTPPKAANATDVKMTVQAPFLGLHWGDQPFAGAAEIDVVTVPLAPAPTWSFKLQKEGAADFQSLGSDEIDDLVLIFQYELKNLPAFPPT